MVVEPGQEPRGKVPNEVVEFYAETGHPFVLTLASGSMAPLIRTGDRVVVDPNRRAAGPGKVIAFRRGNELVVHRVIAARTSTSGEPLLVTKGDRALWSDPPIGSRDVLGTVVRVLRGRREIDLTGWSATWTGCLLFGWSVVGLTIRRGRQRWRRTVAGRITHKILHTLRRARI